MHGSQTSPVRKENEVALQWAEMRMVTMMCGISVALSYKIEFQVKG